LLAADPLEDSLNNPVPRPSILLLILKTSSTRKAMSLRIVLLTFELRSEASDYQHES